MKRITVLLTTFSLLVFVSVGLVSANNEFIVSPGEIIVEEIQAISTNELNAIFKQIEDNFNKKEKTTSDYERALQLISSHSSIVQTTDLLPASPDFTIASYDANKAKLRQANYIETILDLDEGITTTQIAKVVTTHAATAKSAAKDTYPNDSSKEDAFRHYAWNFISTKDSSIGKLKTRTITINHEWGLVLLTPILNYYDNRYQSYLNSGSTQTAAANAAFADTTLYIPDLKYQLVLFCQSSLSTFKALFTADNIMDLYNNCIGRAGPENHSNKTYSQAFFLDYNILILSQSDVTNYFYSYVWQNDWYTY